MKEINNIENVRRLRDVNPNHYFQGKLVGLSATIFHGYSHQHLDHNIWLYTPTEYNKGFETLVVKMKYLEGYDTKTGYENNYCVASSERAICDYLMYPEELETDSWIYDELEGYMVDHEDDLTKVYEMMDYFKIPHEALDPYLDVCFIGG